MFHRPALITHCYIKQEIVNTFFIANTVKSTFFGAQFFNFFCFISIIRLLGAWRDNFHFSALKQFLNRTQHNQSIVQRVEKKSHFIGTFIMFKHSWIRFEFPFFFFRYRKSLFFSFEVVRKAFEIKKGFFNAKKSLVKNWNIYWESHGIFEDTKILRRCKKKKFSSIVIAEKERREKNLFLAK